MTKIIFAGVLASSMLLAFNAEVKKADVNLLVNDQNVSYKAGDTFMLNAGDMVCFVKGDGRVIIKGKSYKKQLSKRSKSCKHLPNEDGKPTSYTKIVKNEVISIFGKSKEKSVDGVSRKAVETDTLTAPIAFGKKAKYLAIENSTWGPLPVTLKVLDAKGNVVETMVNEEDVVTSFILPKSMIKEGYTIKVTNAFDEALVNSVIHVEEDK